jgi:hypothetical protein
MAASPDDMARSTATRFEGDVVDFPSVVLELLELPIPARPVARRPCVTMSSKPALRTPIARGREDEIAAHLGDDRHPVADRTGPGPTRRPRILGRRGPSKPGESASSDNPGKAVDNEDPSGGIQGLGALPAGPDRGIASDFVILAYLAEHASR